MPQEWHQWEWLPMVSIFHLSLPSLLFCMKVLPAEGQQRQLGNFLMENNTLKYSEEGSLLSPPFTLATNLLNHKSTTHFMSNWFSIVSSIHFLKIDGLRACVVFLGSGALGNGALLLERYLKTKYPTFSSFFNPTASLSSNSSSSSSSSSFPSSSSPTSISSISDTLSSIQQEISNNRFFNEVLMTMEAIGLLIKDGLMEIKDFILPSSSSSSSSSSTSFTTSSASSFPSTSSLEWEWPEILKEGWESLNSGMVSTVKLLPDSIQEYLPSFESNDNNTTFLSRLTLPSRKTTYYALGASASAFGFLGLEVIYLTRRIHTALYTTRYKTKLQKFRAEEELAQLWVYAFIRGSVVFSILMGVLNGDDVHVGLEMDRDTDRIAAHLGGFLFGLFFGYFFM